VIRHLKQSVQGIDKAIISVHCHNDLGLAVANSLAAVMEVLAKSNARSNGIGERAGNAAMEEIVMALRTRRDFYQCDTQIQYAAAYPASRLVANVTGIQVQRNKAIVGRNAFAHEAGIHQDGMLKERSTYEIMRPEDVWSPTNGTRIGKAQRPARTAPTARRSKLPPNRRTTHAVFEDFKVLADKRKISTTPTWKLSWNGTFTKRSNVWELVFPAHVGWHRDHPDCDIAHAQGRGRRVSRRGNGRWTNRCRVPCHGTYLRIEVTLGDFQVRSVSSGKDAQGEVTVEVRQGDHVYRGRGISTDIIEASARAYLSV